MDALTRWSAIALVAGLLPAAGCDDAPERPTNIPDAVTRSALDGARLALEAFQEDVGRPPTVVEALEVLAEPPVDAAGAARWQGPYVESVEVFTDGWGRPLQYTIDADGFPLIYSVGPDGEDDQGAGDDIIHSNLGLPPAKVLEVPEDFEPFDPEADR